MAKRTTTLSGLRGNYKNNYQEGQVVYRKYKKEWHIYVSTVPTAITKRSKVFRAPNDNEYVYDNADLLLALQKAGKPLSTINDKSDNTRYGLQSIRITYDTTTGEIKSHKLLVESPEDIKSHGEEMKDRRAQYEKMPSFATFLAHANDN